MIERRQPVRVYWNFKHRCYSIFQGGAVRASARAIHLDDVEFRVREAARRRMVEQGRKSIHAYAIGRLVDFVHPAEDRELTPFSGPVVRYDPYRDTSFVSLDSGRPIHRVLAARFDESGVRVVEAEPAAA